jgi:hypothetical protein
MYSGEYDACDVTLSVYPQCYSECISTYVTLSVYPWSGIFFKPARCGYTLRVTSQASNCMNMYTANSKKGCPLQTLNSKCAKHNGSIIQSVEKSYMGYDNNSFPNSCNIQLPCNLETCAPIKLCALRV